MATRFKSAYSKKDSSPNQKGTSLFCARNLFFCLLFLSGFFGLAYIFQVNKIAIMGYEIKDREQQLKRIEEENDQLRINLSSLQSIYLLEEKKEELGMVNPEKVDFIELKGVEKLVLAK